MNVKEANGASRRENRILRSMTHGWVKFRDETGFEKASGITAPLCWKSVFQHSSRMAGYVGVLHVDFGTQRR